jgi:hypothetical protein
MGNNSRQSKSTRVKALIEIVILLAFAGSVIVLVAFHQLLGNGTTSAKVLLSIGWIPLSTWVGLRIYKLVQITNDGDPRNDGKLVLAKIVALYAIYFMYFGYTFTLLWAFDDTKYWSALPSWGTPYASFYTIVHMTFTSVLSNGVGFGLHIPQTVLSETIYMFSNYVLYALNLLCIGSAVAIIFENKKRAFEKHQREREARKQNNKKSVPV